MKNSRSLTKLTLNSALTLAVVAGGALWLAPETSAQGPAKAAPQVPIKGTVEQIKVHGESLEGNLAGDSPDRDVFVYLPPSYQSNPDKHYPVVYFLHGYGSTAQAYWNLMAVPQVAGQEMGDSIGEMIIVAPDAKTKYDGSMYSNSPVTGDWETYVAHDLVDYIDKNYRTIPSREARGLVGHSMGGYGVLRVGMKHPEMFGALYAMSSCCLLNTPQPPNPNQAKAAPAAKGKAPDAKGAAKGKGGGFALVGQAQAAAWSPNPSNPPDYFDMPVADGVFNPLVAARYAANSPLVMVSQYVDVLKSFKSIMVDCGLQDTLIGSNQQLDAVLTQLQVPHTFETYQGDHMSGVPNRFADNVLPYFSEQLLFEQE